MPYFTQWHVNLRVIYMNWQSKVWNQCYKTANVKILCLFIPDTSYQGWAFCGFLHSLQTNSRGSTLKWATTYCSSFKFISQLCTIYTLEKVSLKRVYRKHRDNFDGLWCEDVRWMILPENHKQWWALVLMWMNELLK